MSFNRPKPLFTPGGVAFSRFRRPSRLSYQTPLSNFVLAPDSGTAYTFTGTAVTLGVGITLTSTGFYFGTPSYELREDSTFELREDGGKEVEEANPTCTAVTLKVGQPLGGATYNVVGTAVTLKVGMPLGSGTYTCTGANGTIGCGIPLGGSTYTCTGSSVIFAIGMPLGTGSYSCTGGTTTPGVGLPCGSSTYSYTGTDVILTATVAYHVTLETTTFVFSGSDPNLTYIATTTATNPSGGGLFSALALHGRQGDVFN